MCTLPTANPKLSSIGEEEEEEEEFFDRYKNDLKRHAHTPSGGHAGGYWQRAVVVGSFIF